jgi:hypothetical protein
MPSASRDMVGAAGTCTRLNSSFTTVATPVDPAPLLRQ